MNSVWWNRLIGSGRNLVRESEAADLTVRPFSFRSAFLVYGVGVALLAFSLPLQTAGVFRCDLEDGSVSFQFRVCDQGRQKQVRVPVVNEIRALPAAEIKRLSGSKKSPRRAARKVVSGSSVDRKQQLSCWKREKQLEDVRYKLRRGYKALQRDGLQRAEQRHQEFLDLFC
jgi:hypothetical protein